MTMSVVTSVNTVGSKKLPPWAARLPPITTLAPFLTASAMCASTFSTAFMSISEALRKGVREAVLHEDSVSADAVLAGVPVVRGDRALDRHLDVGVVEDNATGSLPPGSSDSFLTVR